MENSEKEAGEFLFNAIDFLCPSCNRLAMIFWYINKPFYEFDCKCEKEFIFHTRKNKIWDKASKVEVIDHHAVFASLRHSQDDNHENFAPLTSDLPL